MFLWQSYVSGRVWEQLDIAARRPPTPDGNVEGKRSGVKFGGFVARNFPLPNASLPFLIAEPGASAAPQLRLHGQIGTRLAVDTPADLTDWAATATNAAKVGGVVLPLDLAAGTRFFRVHEE